MENTLAAQYLRVSTERQEYSLECQRAGIEAYAQVHNFTVCSTYVDEAKSGLGIKHRIGLSQLLQDVLGGNCPFKSILVYDVSRWGRFQDPDEAAHYEFLCKTAGAEVHYCAEHFGNDTYLPNVVLKALKRVMAGEYSRELSEKVLAGSKRIASDGFRVGGEPGYGFRRMLISTDRRPKGEIPRGERKSMSNERVRLIPGPDTEIHWVREIYRWFVSENRSVRGIADELNRLNVPFLGGRKWQDASVRGILRNPKYKGTAVYNRTSGKLGSAQRVNTEADWIVIPCAFPPIVEPKMFDAAQEVFRNRPWNLSNPEVLEALRSILNEKGKLSMKIICGASKTMTKDSYARRFGSLTRAFALAGYESRQNKTIAHRSKIQKVRSELMENLVRLFPGVVAIQTRGPVRRNCIRLRNGTRVAVRACRRKQTTYKGPSWVLQRAREKCPITLLVCVNPEYTAPELMYVLPCITNRRQVSLFDNHSWLRSGIQLRELSSFCDAVSEISRRGKRSIGGGRKPKGWLSEDARTAMADAHRIRWAAKNVGSG